MKKSVLNLRDKNLSIIKKVLLSFVLLALANINFIQAQTTSFPGAEGYGRFTQGGRGGDVYIVTNLKDSGEGSLRYGVENASGPRTIVFEVSGNIELKDHLVVKTPYVTIAGQTAPGDGICIKDYGFKITDTHDVIVRYIRIRLGDENKVAPAGYDAIETNGVSNIIFDHISASWGIDGIHDLRGELFTLQWSIYGEALNNSLHEKGTHAMLSSMRDLTDNITLHHNLMHSSRDRHPTLGGSNTLAGVITDFRNNLVFNWDGGTNFGSGSVNAINNYYKPGESTNLGDEPLRIKADIGAGDPKGFVGGNVFPWNTEWTEDNFLAINYINSGNYISTTREEYALPGELVFGDDKPWTHSAIDAYDIVLQYAGASLSRDAADARMVAGVKDGTGRLIDSQSEVGGYPQLNSLPAPEDLDRDGMSDLWETSNGLDPADPEDRNGDRNFDGYTNLEEYLYSLVSNYSNIVPVANIISPLADEGYFQTDTVFVNAIAMDYYEGSIKNFELFLDDVLIFSSELSEIDTFLTGLSTGAHTIKTRATDDSASIAIDSVRIYVGTKLCTITLDPVVGKGNVTLDPPGGTYMEGMEVRVKAIPTFPNKFDSWTGDIISSDNPLLLTLIGDIALTANFVMDSSSVLNINFQPPSFSCPDEYIPDVGEEYGMRESGMEYGWILGPQTGTRDRGGSNDPRKKTLNHFDKPSKNIWEIGLDQGTYAVNVHLGDADYADQDNNIDLEGIVRNDPKTGSPYFDDYYFDEVTVNDGRLTIAPKDGGPKINFVKIALKESAFGRYLLVNDGEGSGEKNVGEVVYITAEEAAANEVFRWTGDTDGIADVNAITTTITMPANDQTITASYLGMYTLVVLNGEGGGDKIEGDTVSISANTAADGLEFKEWTSNINTVYFDDINASETRIVMPDSDLTLKANYGFFTDVENMNVEQSLRCFPNPANSSFSIDLTNIGRSGIEIYNMFGQLVYSAFAPGGVFLIEDHNFLKAMYLIKVTDKDRNILTRKLVIE